MAAYSLKRSLAVHEAAHGAAAWLLGHRFKTVSIGDGRHSGSFDLAPAADWLAPEVLEARAAILLAGPEAERVWCARNPDAPPGWLQRVSAGRARDLRSAQVLAGCACGGRADLAKTYLNHVRRQVLGLTGTGSADQGDERFWALTSALADVLRSSWILTGSEARRVLERVP